MPMNDKYLRNTFIYGGFHFTPIKCFDKSKTSYEVIMRKLKSDKETELSSYKNTYSYKSFYAASPIKECDIFRCAENGKLYVPCENELFEYTGYEIGITIPITAIKDTLPESCMSVLPSNEKQLIIIKANETGYYLPCIATDGLTAREYADKFNSENSVTKAQEAAMLCGSLFGWDTPGADPRNYDEKGQPIPPKKNRER